MPTWTLLDAAAAAFLALVDGIADPDLRAKVAQLSVPPATNSATTTQGVYLFLMSVFTSGTWYLTLEGYQNAQDNVPLKAIIFYGIFCFYSLEIC